MRARIASALFVLFASLSFPHFASAQSRTTSSQPPRQTPQNAPSTVKPLEPPKVTQTTPLPSQTGSASDQENMVQALKAWVNMLQQREERFGLRRFGGGLDTANCAHIRIIQAPEMDSEMVLHMAPGDGGPIQTFQGLPPCRRDLPAPMAAQRFYGPPVLQAPPRTPFVPLQPSQLPSAQAPPAQPSTKPAPKP